MSPDLGSEQEPQARAIDAERYIISYLYVRKLSLSSNSAIRRLGQTWSPRRRSVTITLAVSSESSKSPTSTPLISTTDVWICYLGCMKEGRAKPNHPAM